MIRDDEDLAIHGDEPPECIPCLYGELQDVGVSFLEYPP